MAACVFFAVPLQPRFGAIFSMYACSLYAGLPTDNVLGRIPKRQSEGVDGGRQVGPRLQGTTGTERPSLNKHVTLVDRLLD